MADINDTDHTDFEAALEMLQDASGADEPGAEITEALMALIRMQAERIGALESKLEAMQAERDRERDRLLERVRELTAENRRLREERDETERAGKRQAAPFRPEATKRSSSPSRPGRAGIRPPTAGNRSRSIRTWTSQSRAVRSVKAR